MAKPRRTPPANVITEVCAVQCLKCKQWVYSRARHDMRSCSCGTIAVDGGFDYMKISGAPKEMRHGSFGVKASKEDLYRDWSTGKDEYGRFFVIGKA